MTHLERWGSADAGVSIRERYLVAAGYFGLVAPIVAMILACLTAWDGILDIYRRWSFEEEYGYGFLLLAVVCVLLWRRWPTNLSYSSKPKWPGLSLVIVSQLVGVLAALGESYFIEQIA